MRLLLGYDVGSSSIKASLLDADTGRILASAASPEKELDIIAPQSDWAEQHPQTWWDNVLSATHKIKSLVKLLAISLRLGIKLFHSSPVLFSDKLIVSRLPTNLFSFDISILGFILMFILFNCVSYYACH